MIYRVEMLLVMDAACEEDADRVAEAVARHVAAAFGPSGSEQLEAVVARASVEVVVPKRLLALPD
jgi:hypothetical protein